MDKRREQTGGDIPDVRIYRDGEEVARLTPKNTRIIRHEDGDFDHCVVDMGEGVLKSFRDEPTSRVLESKGFPVVYRASPTDEAIGSYALDGIAEMQDHLADQDS